MPPLAQEFLRAFIPLFVAIDPIGLAAVFLALGREVPIARRRQMAWQATLTGGVVALTFLFLGANIFRALGITTSDFQVAGGLILFILAARDLIQGDAVAERVSQDWGVVPLGMPLIAGPALITTLIALAQTEGLRMTLAGLVANLALVAFAFAFSERIGRLAGEKGLRAVSKIVAMLLAAIAVNMIRRGWAG